VSAVALRSGTTAAQLRGVLSPPDIQEHRLFVLYLWSWGSFKVPAKGGRSEILQFHVRQKGTERIGIQTGARDSEIPPIHPAFTEAEAEGEGGFEMRDLSKTVSFTRATTRCSLTDGTSTQHRQWLLECREGVML